MKIFNVLTKGDGSAQVLLYGYVGEGEKIDAANVVAQLMELESQYSKIDIHINSNGGDVFNGIAIYNALKTCKSDISIYIDGVAASIAGIIALCGKPLYMNKYSRLMLHAVSGGSYGNASDLRKTADMMEDIQHDLASMIAKKCGMNEDAIYAKYFDEKDHWISADEAKEMGIIDGIYNIEEDENETPDTSSTEQIYKYFNNRLNTETQNQEQEMKLDAIKVIDAFKDVANDEEALKMMGDLAEKSLLVDSLKSEVETLKNELADLHAKADEAIIDKAIEVGKIKNEQKETFMNLLRADKENTIKLLDSLAVPAKEEPKPQPKQIEKAVEVFKNEDNPLFTASYDELDKQNKLIELKNTNFEVFKSKYFEKWGVEYKGEKE